VTDGSKPRLFDVSAAPDATEGEPAPPLTLDDLPLFGEREESAPLVAEPPEKPQPALEFEPEPVSTEGKKIVESAVEVEPATPTPPGRSQGPASLTDRLGAALLDLGVMAATAIALVGGAALLGATPRPSDWPLIAVPWLLFSFLYYVVPVAFWGRTPGMASMSLTARTLDNRPLSLGQSVRRWLATLGTTALVGLPGLLAISGRSATDRLSQSMTRWDAPPTSSET